MRLILNNSNSSEVESPSKSINALLLSAATSPMTPYQVIDTSKAELQNELVQNRLALIQRHTASFMGNSISYRTEVEKLWNSLPLSSWVAQIIENPRAIITPDRRVVVLDEATYETVSRVVGCIPRTAVLVNLFGESLTESGITAYQLEDNENLRLNLCLLAIFRANPNFSNWLLRKAEDFDTLWNRDGRVNIDKIPNSESWTETEFAGIGHVPVPKAYEGHIPTIRDYLYSAKRVVGHPVDNRARIGEFDFDTNPTRFGILLRWWERTFIMNRPGDHDKGYSFSTTRPFVGTRIINDKSHEDDIFDRPADVGRAMNDVEFDQYRRPISRISATYTAASAPIISRRGMDLDDVKNLVGSERT